MKYAKTWAFPWSVSNNLEPSQPFQSIHNITALCSDLAKVSLKRIYSFMYISLMFSRKWLVSNSYKPQQFKVFPVGLTFHIQDAPKTAKSSIERKISFRQMQHRKNQEYRNIKTINWKCSLETVLPASLSGMYRRAAHACMLPSEYPTTQNLSVIFKA